MIVKFVKPGIKAGLAYAAGEIVDIKSNDLVNALKEDGIVRAAPPGSNTKNVLDLSSK